MLKEEVTFVIVQWKKIHRLTVKLVGVALSSLTQFQRVFQPKTYHSDVICGILTLEI